VKRLLPPVALLLLALAASNLLNCLYPTLFAAPMAREQVEGTAPAGWTYMYGLEWLQTISNGMIVLSVAWLMIRIIIPVKPVNQGKIDE